MLTKEEVLKLYKNSSKEHFKKRGTFIFRNAKPNETVLTIVSGKLETIKTVPAEESVVLRNIEIGSSAESYIIDKKVFDKRYDVIEDVQYVIDNVKWTKAVAKGEVMAFEYVGEPIRFMAPWNEEMLCEPGDYIASPIGGDPYDIYRIEKDTFNQTYYKCQE